jgi:carboxymethylenebutenolidase
MPEEIRELLAEYQEGRITRREFVARAVTITGSLAAADALLGSLFSSAPAYAATVDPNDPALVSERVTFAGSGGTVFGYLSRPKDSARRPAIIVIHQNSGLNDHIEDVARRFAKEGFVALAPDYLSRHGGKDKVPGAEKGLGNISQLAPSGVVREETEAAIAYLKGRKEVRADHIGVVGFCWGGTSAFFAATQIRGLKAVVVYYGSSPNPIDLVRHIEAPVMAHYGEKDQVPNINARIPETAEAMAKYNKVFEYKIYSGAGHAFNDDSRATRYHPESSKEAWTKTVAFLKKHST